MHLYSRRDLLKFGLLPLIPQNRRTRRIGVRPNPLHLPPAPTGGVLVSARAAVTYAFTALERFRPVPATITVACVESWLSVSVPGGSPTNSVTVSAGTQVIFYGDPAALSAGSYTGHAIMSGAGMQSVTVPLLFVVNVGPPTHVAIVTPPSGVIRNQAFGLTVQAQDAGNVIVSSYTTTATVAKTSGPGTLTGTTSAAFVGGSLTFSNLFLDTSGTYTLTITSGSLTSATTTAFTVTLPSFTDGFANTGSNLDGANWSYVAGGPMTQNSGVATGAGAGAGNFSLAEHLYAQVDGTYSTTAIPTSGTAVSSTTQAIARFIAGTGQTATFVAAGVYKNMWPGLIFKTGASTVKQMAIAYPDGSTDSWTLVSLSGRVMLKRGAVALARLNQPTLPNSSDAHIGVLAYDTATVGGVTMSGDTSTLPTATATDIVVADGNSLSASGFSVTDAQGWFSQVAAALPSTTDFANYAISGQTIGQMKTAQWPMVLDLSGYSGQKTCVVWEGTNSLANSTCTTADGLATIYAYVQYCTLLRAQGWRVLVGTIIPRTGTILGSNTSGFETQRLILDTYLRTNHRYFSDGLPDFASDPALASVTGTYYNGDNVHLLAAGHTRLVPTASGAIGATLPAFGPASNIGLTPTAGYNRCVFDAPIYVTAGSNAQLYFKAATTHMYFQCVTLDTAIGTPGIQVFDQTTGGTYLGNFATSGSGQTFLTLTVGHYYLFVVFGFDASNPHNVQLQFFDNQSPSTATRIGFIQQPYSGTNGATFPTQPLLAAVDANNNVDTGYTSSVTLSIVSGTGTGGAALTGTVTINFVAGIATFSGVALNTAGDNYQLKAHSGTLTDAISDPLFVS